MVLMSNFTMELASTSAGQVDKWKRNLLWNQEKPHSWPSRTENSAFGSGKGYKRAYYVRFKQNGGIRRGARGSRYFCWLHPKCWEPASQRKGSQRQQVSQEIDLKSRWRPNEEKHVQRTHGVCVMLKRRLVAFNHTRVKNCTPLETAKPKTQSAGALKDQISNEFFHRCNVCEKGQGSPSVVVQENRRRLQRHRSFEFPHLVRVLTC